MTTDLKKQFFDTFGIEPKLLDGCEILRCVNQHPSNCTKEECPFYFKGKIRYPQITDRILLELICILLSNNSPYMFKLGDWDVEKLKDTVLTMCIKLPDFLEWEDTSEYFKHQVRTLFEEG